MKAGPICCLLAQAEALQRQMQVMHADQRRIARHGPQPTLMRELRRAVVQHIAMHAHILGLVADACPAANDATLSVPA